MAGDLGVSTLGSGQKLNAWHGVYGVVLVIGRKSGFHHRLQIKNGDQQVFGSGALNMHSRYPFQHGIENMNEASISVYVLPSIQTAARPETFTSCSSASSLCCASGARRLPGAAAPGIQERQA